MHCLFCGEELKNDDRHLDRYSTNKAELTSLYSVQAMCSQRGDQWALVVEVRLGSYTDLVTAEVEYHRQCRQNFYSGKMKPVKSKSSKKAARHNGEDMDASFQLLEVFTLPESQEERKSFSETGKPYNLP